MPAVNIYLSKAEAAFVKEQAPGYVRGLVQQAIAGGGEGTLPQGEPPCPRTTSPPPAFSCPHCGGHVLGGMCRDCHKLC